MSSDGTIPCISVQPEYVVSSHEWSMLAASLACFYLILLLCSYPFVRVHTPVPFFFLFLILAFPPGFFVLFVYLCILRLGLLSTWWYIDAPGAAENAVQIQVS